MNVQGTTNSRRVSIPTVTLEHYRKSWMLFGKDTKNEWLNWNMNLSSWRMRTKLSKPKKLRQSGKLRLRYRWLWNNWRKKWPIRMVKNSCCSVLWNVCRKRSSSYLWSLPNIPTLPSTQRGLGKVRICLLNYCQTSNISGTLVGNKIVDHSDVAGASPVGAAPTTSSFSTQHLVSMDWAETTARRNEKH